MHIYSFVYGYRHDCVPGALLPNATPVERVGNLRSTYVGLLIPTIVGRSNITYQLETVECGRVNRKLTNNAIHLLLNYTKPDQIQCWV